MGRGNIPRFNFRFNLGLILGLILTFGLWGCSDSGLSSRGGNNDNQ